MIHLKNLVQITAILHIIVVPVLCGQGWSHIPEIPAGRRAQYLLLKQDGGYKYGYDTGEGSSAFQSASGANEVTGNYAYAGGDGLTQEIQYTSGVSGFVPKLSPQKSIGQAGSIAVAKTSHDITQSSGVKQNVGGSYQYFGSDSQRKVQYNASPGTDHVVSVDRTRYPGKPATIENINTKTSQRSDINLQSSVPISVNTHQITNTPIANEDESNGDASYAFSYSSIAHTRDETSDSQGNVQGTYSYVDPTGVQQKYDYIAGDKTGFVVKNTLGSNTGSSSFSKSAVQNTYAGALPQPIPFVPSTLSQNYNAGPYPQPSPNYLPSSDYDETGPSDASYSFNYQAPDHSRQEASDASGNVQGSFSFVAKDDGLTRTVNYIAGADTGFVASGAHLPESSSTQQSGSSVLQKTYPVLPQVTQTNYNTPVVPSTLGHSAAPTPAQTDGSYSFSYNAGDHSREENGDSSGNVQGSYSFVAKDDGVTRKVDYSANSATGFVAHLSPSDLPTQSYTKTSLTSDASSAAVLPQTSYSSNALSSTGASLSSDVTSGGAYSFSYDAGDHSRSEVGDANGNVKGSYSFIAKDDKLERTVDYSAGAETGFLATGDHLPVPVEAHYSSADVSSGVSKYYSSTPQLTSITPTSGSLPISTGSQFQPAIPDSSYSFSYDANDHSRSESSDANGNVRGRFSFVAKDDGLTRTVDYSAGSSTGFLAKGSHIPVPSSPTVSQPSSSSFVKTNLASSSLEGTYDQSAEENYDNGDPSYSYSYETDSSSKQESSDSQGNVVGSFSFLGGDGLSRTVQYTSKGSEGFIANGEHLPKPGVYNAIPQSSSIASSRTQINDRASSGIKSSSHVTNSGFSKSYNTKTLSHTKNLVSNDQRLSNVIYTYLPPDSEKFGYIYDTV